MIQKTRNARLLPVDPAAREIAFELYESVANLPIISPHGHVSAKMLLENKPFANPAELFIYFDHYVTRLLHAAGFSMGQLGKSAETQPREAWRILCSNWHLLAGTSSGYWLTHEFETLFEIYETPNAENADELFDRISVQLTAERMLPQALFKSFNIEFLATTDDPCDDLAAHKALAIESSLRVAPTFRPDAYIDPRAMSFIDNVKNLLALTKKPSATFAHYLAALRERRRYFIESGAVSVDIGVYEPYSTSLSDAVASQLFDAALAGTITQSESREFAGHMLTEMAAMSCEDGLVMTLHAGVYRNHSRETLTKYGTDTGHDIPVSNEFVRNLHPLLERHGLNPNLHLILFSLDETNWGREIASMAGFYPSVFIGAPWWFLDAPDSATRFREATTEIAGFYRGSGFIDDTRAFLSIPARHDMARRVDCAYLARLVIQERITIEQAKSIAHDLVVAIPKKAFKL